MIHMFHLPDSALWHTWHRQCDVQGELALPSEDAHHTEGLHLTAGGIDWGTPQICQLAKDNTVLIWDGTARTAIWWWFICCKVSTECPKKRVIEKRGKRFDYFINFISSYDCMPISLSIHWLALCKIDMRWDKSGRRNMWVVKQNNSCVNSWNVTSEDRKGMKILGRLTFLI